jgi:hypothetical protein
MLPMGFQPRSGGALTDTLNTATLHAAVEPLVWRRALSLKVEGSWRLSPAYDIVPVPAMSKERRDQCQGTNSVGE